VGRLTPVSVAGPLAARGARHSCGAGSSDVHPRPLRAAEGEAEAADHPSGMNATAALEPAARIDRMLRQEPVVWVSTVRPDGSPHLVPIWFSWDGRQVFIASKPNAVKVRNLRANQKVFLALGEPDDDFDVGMFEGRATIPDRTTAEMLPAGHLEKYRRQMADIGLDADEYLATYSQPVIIEPTRYLPWHGRTVPASARPARSFGWTWPALRPAIERVFGLRRPLGAGSAA
jgi:PPOX class probable F420-dependent enzyme